MTIRLSHSAWRPARTIVLLAAAFSLFSYGARTGAGQTFYVDEAFYDRYALELAQALFVGGPVKFGYVHPSGFSVVLMVIYGGWYALGRLAGEFTSTADFLVRFAVHRGEFVILGRWTSAVFATAALPGTYLAARRLFSPTVGLISAVALAVCYPMVFYAHIAANLTMLMCLSAWTLYWTIRVWQEGTLRTYLAAGALIGAGIGTKYYPAVLFLPLVLAHCYRAWDTGSTIRRRVLVGESWKLLAAACIALPVALVLFPVPLFAPDQWRLALADTMSFYTGGNPLQNTFTSLFGSATVLEQATAEPVSWWSNSFLVLSHTGLLWILAGLAYAMVAFRRAAWLLAAAFLVFFAYQVCRGGLGLGVRQFYFALPGLWILAAAALADCCHRFVRPAARVGTAMLALACVLLAEPAWWAARFLYLSSRPTTVEVARVDMTRLIPAGSVLLVDSMAAPYGETAGWRGVESIHFVADGPSMAETRAARRRAAPQFDVREFAWHDAALDLQSAREGGAPVYVAVTDYFSEGYWDPDTRKAWGNLHPREAPGHIRYLRDLFALTEPVIVYRPRDLQALGPTVTLRRVKPGA